MNGYKHRLLLTGLGTMALICCLAFPSTGYAHYNAGSVGSESVKMRKDLSYGTIAANGDMQFILGQDEVAGATDRDRQNLYATIAGFVAAGIPVYYIWRRRRKNK